MPKKRERPKPINERLQNRQQRRMAGVETPDEAALSDGKGRR
jgi:hypothetical protein